MATTNEDRQKRELSADYCVIGSGFGGAMAARKLVAAGADVLMLERGDWVSRGPDNWAPGASLDLTPYYAEDTPYEIEAGGNAPHMGGYHCVGGPSVFYGCVSLRYREHDFRPHPEVRGRYGLDWPFGYAALEPYYAEAERILDIAGDDSDPTAPFRSTPYPQAPAPLSGISARVAEAGRGLELQPMRLPLAINYRANARACVRCNTCDTFACAVNAKNDVATVVLPGLLAAGMRLRPETVVTRLVTAGGRVTQIEAVDRRHGTALTIKARHVVLAAGALATPHLLLASGLDRANPAGALVGRHLMRHVNGIVFGVFPRLPGPTDEFHKQVGFFDYYYGCGQAAFPRGKWGCIQQLATPPQALVRHFAPRGLGGVAASVAKRMTGLLVMAEDQAHPHNHVRLHRTQRDRYGLPTPIVRHTYSERDLLARRQLAVRAKRILKRAGARAFYHHRIATFSHACGTVRMGAVAEAAPVAPDGGFRGIENLTITDGSVLPTSAGLNPSLTIAANALRVGASLAERRHA